MAEHTIQKPMIETRTYHGIQLDIARKTVDRICYILLPEGLKDDGKKWIEKATEKFGITLVVMSGFDWNDSLTPWTAEGVFRKAKPFGGRAEHFLKELKEDYFPSIESTLGMKRPTRYLVGISLSGLFAVWATFRCDMFRSIASISGSLWYDGFSAWIQKQELSPSVKKFFISLGDKEKKSKDKRMARVEEETAKIVDILREKKVRVEYVLEENTTHFSPFIPRVERAMESLFNAAEWLF